MTFGPIQLIAINFEDFVPTGKVLPAINAAAESGAIRLIDLQYVGKDQAGRITSMEMSGLSPAEQVEFGAVIGGLIGAGAAGELGLVEGSIAGAMAAAERSYGMTLDDIQSVADELPPGGAAAILLIEHRWATEFRDAVAEAGGEMMAQGFLTPKTLLLVGAELEAQAEALEAIALSEAIQEEAALEALEAIAISEVIQAKAAREAMAALVAAELIEEAALEEATAVVLGTLAIEETAVEEAE